MIFMCIGDTLCMLCTVVMHATPNSLKVADLHKITRDTNRRLPTHVSHHLRTQYKSYANEREIFGKGEVDGAEVALVIL